MTLRHAAVLFTLLHSAAAQTPPPLPKGPPKPPPTRAALVVELNGALRAAIATEEHFRKLALDHVRRLAMDLAPPSARRRAREGRSSSRLRDQLLGVHAVNTIALDSTVRSLRARWANLKPTAGERDEFAAGMRQAHRVRRHTKLIIERGMAAVLDGRELPDDLDVAPPAAKPPADAAWLNFPERRRGDVFDPSVLPPLPWPEDTTLAQRRRILSLLGQFVRYGRDYYGPRARKSLLAFGSKALPAIVNRMRRLDQSDTFDAGIAGDLNVLLEELLPGERSGFAPVAPDEEVDPRKAEWNAQIAVKWERAVRAEKK